MVFEYDSSVIFPPQPQFSFPIAKYFTFHGSSRPFSLRSLVIGLTASEVRYSIQSAISLTEPDPTFPFMYASQPSSSVSFMNSCVPNELSSVTPPQLVFIIEALFSFGPIPSFQWSVSAKQPPGHRRLGTLISRRANSTSFLIPYVFGIFESVPTHRPPYIQFPRCSEKCP